MTAGHGAGRGASRMGSVYRYRSTWRVRGPSVGGKRVALGSYATKGEADAVLRAALDQLARVHAVERGSSITLKSFGATFFNRRRAAGNRSVPTDTGRWRVHISTSPFFDAPVSTITHQEVRRWVIDVLCNKTAADRCLTRAAPAKVKLGRGRVCSRRLSEKTARRVLSLLSAAFQELVGDGEMQDNPARGIRIRGRPTPTEPWTYLEPHEQTALLESPQIPEGDRCIIAFCLSTGMRPSEVASLHLEDLHVGDEPHVIVRYGKALKVGGVVQLQVPKSGKPRRVELFGAGLAAVRRWLELLPGMGPNPQGLVFPNSKGNRRDETRLVKRFHQYCQQVGIERPVRFYDLRHTAASSLVAGWFGAPWSIERVKEQLGHSSITVTQRYAHIGVTALKQAAAEINLAHELGTARVVFRRTEPQAEKQSA